jgi:predicted RND superfamily exporter protein
MPHDDQGMMERHVRFVVRHRLAVVITTLVVTALLGTELRHVRVEIKRSRNMPQQHPYVQIQNRITDLFGGDAITIIGIVVHQGDIFTSSILGKVYRITRGLQATPGIIETSLLSIAAPYVKAVVPRGDGMIDIHPLLDNSAPGAEDIRQIREAIRQDKIFQGNLVSRDEAATVIVADFDARLTDLAIAKRVEELVAPERDKNTTIALAGAPILTAALTHYTALIAILFPVAVLAIALIHYEAFRTLQAMILPVVTALLSVIWALGIMGVLRQAMDTWSAITPVVILAIAAGHAVQILKRYYEEYALTSDSEQAVIRSLSAVGPVMLAAGLIASAGFGSLTTFGIASVRVFGLLMASGILSALIIEMTFTPACRCLLPAPRGRELRREEEASWLDHMLEKIAHLVVTGPRAVLLSALLAVMAAALGMLALRVDSSVRFWFNPSTQVRKDDALLNEKLAGTATVRILVQGQRGGVLQEPAVLRAMSDFQRLMESDSNVGGVMSLVDYVKRMHQAMHDGNPTFYAIPDNERLISQYLLLYSVSAGPDSLSAFVDSTYRYGTIRALSKTDTGVFSRAFLNRLQDYAAKRFEGLPATLQVAGGTLGVQTAMNDDIVHEKVVNIIQVSVIIFVLSALVLRSLIGGLFVLTPLACAVLVNLGIMGWSRTWLDMTTAAITAMGVSIGADFAIYLIYRIREEAGVTGSIEEAISAALRTSGKAVFFVSSAVAVGYLVLPFSGFSVWTRLGAFTALIIAASALASLTVIPSLALLFKPRFLTNYVPVIPLARAQARRAITMHY